MLSFDFNKNKDRIEKAINKQIQRAGIKDPEGFTLLEGIVIPRITPLLEDIVPVDGRLFPQVAIIGNSTGVVYYFYLDKLFPGEGLD